MDASGAFLVNFLTENNLTYDEFILQVLKITQEQLDYYFSDAY